MSIRYLGMLKTLGVKDDKESHATLIDDRCRNTLAIDNTGRVAQEDYILTRANGARLNVRRERIVFRQMGWDGNRRHCDLSYRYALCASITFR
jgi:hypothetical protein